MTIERSFNELRQTKSCAEMYKLWLEQNNLYTAPFGFSMRGIIHYMMEQMEYDGLENNASNCNCTIDEIKCSHCIKPECKGWRK